MHLQFASVGIDELTERLCVSGHGRSPRSCPADAARSCCHRAAKKIKAPPPSLAVGPLIPQGPPNVVTDVDNPEHERRDSYVEREARPYMAAGALSTLTRSQARRPGERQG